MSTKTLGQKENPQSWNSGDEFGVNVHSALALLDEVSVWKKGSDHLGNKTLIKNVYWVQCEICFALKYFKECWLSFPVFMCM